MLGGDCWYALIFIFIYLLGRGPLMFYVDISGMGSWGGWLKFPCDVGGQC